MTATIYDENLEPYYVKVSPAYFWDVYKLWWAKNEDQMKVRYSKIFKKDEFWIEENFYNLLNSLPNN